MIHIYYTEFNQRLPNHFFYKYLKRLPQILVKKNKKYKFWEDRHRHLFGLLLLIEGFKRYGMDKTDLSDIQYNKYGRPYVENSLDFNISHSGKYAICAIVDNMSIGIDVEELKPVDFDVFNDIMDEKEWQVINNSPNPIRTFFDYWTIKESVIKADGRGMSVSLSDIRITKNQSAHLESKEWFLTKLNFMDHASSYIACNKRCKVLIKKINFYKTAF